jgi:hypothetical protein
MEPGLRYRALAGSAIAHEEQKHYADALPLYEEVWKNSPDDTLRTWAAERVKTVRDRLRAAEKPALKPQPAPKTPQKPTPKPQPPAKKK